MSSISVVLAVYIKTSVCHIKRCFDSIVSQTLKPHEIIVVFDGPVTRELTMFICDSKLEFSKIGIDVVLVSTLSNNGPGVARNLGVSISSMSFVAIMDSDDYCDSSRFEIQLEKIREGYDVVGGYISEIYNGSHIVKQVPENNDEILAALPDRNVMNNVTLFVKKDAFLLSGGYAPLRYGEDYILWFRLKHIGARFYNITRPLVYIDADEDFFSRRRGWQVFKREVIYITFLFREGHISSLKFVRKVMRGLTIRFLPSGLLEILYNRCR
ncbi:glycosyltransferase [Aliivibrio finisterrensis]|uniref:glycosyltransferase n=1 Tax=Aliivibrio finisterrensis TaxID=511998 RepID=UPI00142EC0CB|nr:glycosyltransferase [Aliivibrio finisterrensis]